VWILKGLQEKESGQFSVYSNKLKRRKEIADAPNDRHAVRGSDQFSIRSHKLKRRKKMTACPGEREGRR
jgi:hypothetical protein